MSRCLHQRSPARTSADDNHIIVGRHGSPPWCWEVVGGKNAVLQGEGVRQARQLPVLVQRAASEGEAQGCEELSLLPERAP